MATEGKRNGQPVDDIKVRDGEIRKVLLEMKVVGLTKEKLCWGTRVVSKVAKRANTWLAAKPKWGAPGQSLLSVERQTYENCGCVFKTY